MASDDFSSMEIDAIGEILNISLGASATAISTMLNTRVDITTPQVSVVTADEFCFSNLEPAIGVEINYVSGLDGKNIMLLKRKDIKVILELLMGTEIPDEEFELDEMNLSAICEVMNQMMGASSTALSEFLERPVNISTPVSFEIDSEDTFKEKYFIPEVRMVVVKFLLNIDGRLKSEFVNVMPTILVKELLSVFFPEGEDEEEAQNYGNGFGNPDAFQAEAGQMTDRSAGQMPGQAAGQMMGQAAGQMAGQAAGQMAGQAAGQMPGQAAGQMMGQAVGQMAGQAAGQMAGQAAGQTIGQPFLQNSPSQPLQPDMATMALQQQLKQLTANMESLQSEISSLKKTEAKSISGRSIQLAGLEGNGLAGVELEENLDLLMGVSLEISVEIGRTRSQVKDILEFTKGTLVVLDKLAGDPVDLYVNGRCVAKGDVVVVDDSFGIRISEIVKRRL